MNFYLLYFTSTECGHRVWLTNFKKKDSTPWSIVLLVCVFFEALLFAIFTLIMFGIQIQSIYKNETGIEFLKKENRNWRKSSFKSFRDVFGKGFNIYWFSPFTRPVVGGKVESNYSYAV